jgi:hypothetical protein
MDSKISVRLIMLFHRILHLECQTIIINSLITKEEVLIMRPKKERGQKRALTLELHP